MSDNTAAVLMSVGLLLLMAINVYGVYMGTDMLILISLYLLTGSLLALQSDMSSCGVLQSFVLSFLVIFFWLPILVCVILGCVAVELYRKLKSY